MIPVWQAAVLGAIQGLTEFLPISSSAHLVLVPWMFGWGTVDNEMAFDVALHLGTLLAVAIFFFFDWLMIVATYIGDIRMGRWLGSPRGKGALLPKIILGTIPGAVIGFVFEKRIEHYFYHDAGQFWLVALVLAVFGLMLLIGERLGKQKCEIQEVSYRDALLIGLAQALAIVPGVSRSGVTILAGLLLGLKRPAAARFSFLLATPIIAGAALMKLNDLHAGDFNVSLLVGVLTSAVVGIAAIKFLLDYVQKRSYAVFVYYRWLLAAVVLVFWFTRGQTPAQSAPSHEAGKPAVTTSTLESSPKR